MISCGAVALDQLGAGVPGQHAALGVEHEDGVVLDALDEKAKALLALAERFLGLRCFRHVDSCQQPVCPEVIAHRTRLALSVTT